MFSAWPLADPYAAACVLAGGQARRTGPDRADARVAHEAGVLLGLEPQRGYAGGHGGAGLRGRPVVVHGIGVGGGGVGAGLGRDGTRRAGHDGAHGAWQHGADGARHGRPGHRRGGVEAVHGALVVVGRYDRPEGFRAQGTGHLGGPVVVRGIGVEAVVADRGHEAVELGAETSLEFRGCVHCVHGVPLSLSPFRSSVFEPHL